MYFRLIENESRNFDSNEMSRLMRRFYFLMIFMLVLILHQIPQKVQALEEETRIPAGVSMSRFKLISQPTFSEAYNGFGERVPLHSILIRDE